MTQSLQFRLKSGQRIYVNGAVLQVDRKVAIEFLNDVTFMLDNHVLQSEDATTPLKQLYFAIQMVLMDPSTTSNMRQIIDQALEDVMVVFENPQVLSELKNVQNLIGRNRYFESLKVLRGLFSLESSIINSKGKEDADLSLALTNGDVACG